MPVTPIHIKIIQSANIPAGGNAMSIPIPDLTGVSDFRICLIAHGTAGTPLKVNMLMGHAGAIAQVNKDIDSFNLDSLGAIVFTRKYDVFAPLACFIRIFNTGTSAVKVDASLYALKTS